MTAKGVSMTLGDVATWASGGTPNRSVARYWRGEIPWISAATLKHQEVADSDQCVTLEAVRAGSQMAPVGAVLILVRGMSLLREVRVGVATRPVAFNQDVKSLIPSPDVTSRYLMYSIRAREREVRGLVTLAGSGTGVLETNSVKRLHIWIPLLDEQASITRRLDDVSRQVELLERLVAKMQAIRHGIMQQLLTGRTRLPGFDAAWTDTRLGEHVTYVKTVALSRAQLDFTSPLKYLHYGDIHTSPRIFLDAAEAEMPRATTTLARAAGWLQVGDVIFADASEDPVGVGKSVEVTSVPTSGVVPGLHTIAARFDKAVLADGFKAYLQFIPAFRQALLRLAAGTKVLATTRSYISSITLSLPPVDEQRAIATALTDCEREIEVLRRRLAKAKAIKQGMMQELLTGRTRLPAEVAS